MIELVDKDAFLKQERKWYCENCDRRKGVKNGRKCFVYEIGEVPCRACDVDDVLDDLEDFPTASPWHMVEEPPKEEGRYWCAVWFDGHWIFDAAWYTHDISTVIDVPCCERVGGFYKGNTEVHPDYWMPIEPPKEDA